MKIIPVILCGGYGKRLWPLSRKQHPKQTLNIEGEHSMLQPTIMRRKGLKNITDPMIVTNKEHRFPSDLNHTLNHTLEILLFQAASSEYVLEPTDKALTPYERKIFS